MPQREYRRLCGWLIRNRGRWDLVWNSHFDECFKKTFRVLRNTFNFMFNRILHDLGQETVNKDLSFPECRLGICLYWLGRGNYHYTKAEMAGLGVLTVHAIVTQVSASIIENLWQECIKKRWKIWITGGSTPFVGLRLMDATLQSSVHLVELKPARSITILKTFIPLYWWLGST